MRFAVATIVLMLTGGCDVVATFQVELDERALVEAQRYEGAGWVKLEQGADDASVEPPRYVYELHATNIVPEPVAIRITTKTRDLVWLRPVGTGSPRYGVTGSSIEYELETTFRGWLIFGGGTKRLVVSPLPSAAGAFT
ncbi:MAG: hypothetical protein H6723_20090, partial [Sandaracinus sp.]|nr:hypothetical protein [Sandaracinus sp.]